MSDTPRTLATPVATLLLTAVACGGSAMPAHTEDESRLRCYESQTAGLGLRCSLREVLFRGPHDIEVHDGLAFVAGKYGAFSIVELSDPAAPRIRGVLNEGFNGSQTLHVLDGVVIVAGLTLSAVDVSDPDLPVALSHAHHPAAENINGFAAFDERTLLGANKVHQILVLDVSDPLRPQVEDLFNTTTSGGIAPHDLTIVGDHLVVVDQDRAARYQVTIYRIADGDRLLPTDRWSVVGSLQSEELVGANRVVGLGSHVLVASNYSNTVARIDLSRPEDPRIVAIVAIQRGSPCGIDVADGMLFVGAGDTLAVFDTRSSEGLEPLAEFSGTPAISTGTSRGGAHDLRYVNGYVYVTAQADDSVAVFDVTGLPAKRDRLAAAIPTAR